MLVGSSMGGWIALHVALARRDRIAGLIGIAAAPDFTEALMWQAMTFEQRATLMRDGVLHVPSQYGEPYPITRALIEDGRKRLLLSDRSRSIARCGCCMASAIPTCRGKIALRIAEQVTSQDVAGDAGERRRPPPVAPAGPGAAAPNARGAARRVIRQTQSHQRVAAQRSRWPEPHKSKGRKVTGCPSENHRGLW